MRHSYIRDAELRQELESLRGEPIQVTDVDPLSIPCIETSDSECLCRRPLVSVRMITYNHEHYIRQAIEGVMMQKTDFEYELIIGEDCSKDRTREICFEYQKRYPDKIRVLWAEVNVNKLGGNGARVAARCRGEFVAMCEGDDYWTDPLKLQKQVDVMRQYPSVGLCVTGYGILNESTGIVVEQRERVTMPSGLIPGKQFLNWNVYGRDRHGLLGAESVLATASMMYRRSMQEQYSNEDEIARWKLRLGDVPLQLGLAAHSEVAYIPEDMVVYRVTSTGACGTMGAALWKDNLLVRLYFLRKYFQDDYANVPVERRMDYAFTLLKSMKQSNGSHPSLGEGVEYFTKLESSLCGRLFSGHRMAFLSHAIKNAWISGLKYKVCWLVAFGFNPSYCCDLIRRHFKRRFVCKKLHR